MKKIEIGSKMQHLSCDLFLEIDSFCKVYKQFLDKYVDNLEHAVHWYIMEYQIYLVEIQLVLILIENNNRTYIALAKS